MRCGTQRKSRLAQGWTPKGGPERILKLPGVSREEIAFEYVRPHLNPPKGEVQRSRSVFCDWSHSVKSLQMTRSCGSPRSLRGGSEIMPRYFRNACHLEASHAAKSHCGRRPQSSLIVLASGRCTNDAESISILFVCRVHTRMV